MIGPGVVVGPPPAADAGSDAEAFDATVAGVILDRIMEGRMLKDVLADRGMPKPAVVLRWLRENPHFEGAYYEAQRWQSEVLRDEVIQIADDATDRERVAQAKLRCEVRERLSESRNSRYARRVSTEITGAGGGPITLAALTRLSEDALLNLQAEKARLTDGTTLNRAAQEARLPDRPPAPGLAVISEIESRAAPPPPPARRAAG